ncbi:MAG TPA: ATP-dependent DNA helicase RecG [Acidimicrobiales bacterium]|nr:ATP-dependent DNA helicase RecG [Acidimicrobiales bacterium]
MSAGAPRPLASLAGVEVTRLRGVRDRRAEALARAGIESVFDLLTTFPRRYIDRTRRVDLADLAVGDEAAVFGEVTHVASRRTRQGRALVEATVTDGASMHVAFFNQPWRERQLAVGVQALFFGRLTEYRGRRQMTNPVVDVVVGLSGDERDPTRVGGVAVLYPSVADGLTSWEMRSLEREALARAGPLADPLDAALRDRHDLIDRTDAYWQIHRPVEVPDTVAARRRLVFDELLRLQLLLALRRRKVESSASGIAHPVDPADLDVAPGGADASSSLLARFLAGHRHALTGAQRRVLGEIVADMAAPLPMHRLLQGDVGSGKTLVATAALLVAVGGGRQGALMAPTEVLAEQHVASLRADLAGLNVTDDRALGGTRGLVVEELTGRVKARERRDVLARLERGEVDIAVGTHALLTGDVRFAALGAVVIDEQHRFGVEQRATLRDKGREHSVDAADPDLLVMTATPIPRTAAMVLFGDLDLSIIDELPPGRSPVTTVWATGAEEAGAWAAVRAAAEAGQRAYVVCPLVEGSEKVAAAGAVSERDRLAETELAGLRVGLLHGQMPGAEKERMMAEFRAGDLDALVATVVIEVGVDVPEATVIVVEDAWRFGLAQLHQLRGRVGRGDAPGQCWLLGAAPSADAAARLAALVESTDGFHLAEVDLDLRGEGTLLGARQRGASDLALARLVRDADLLAAARAEAGPLVAAGFADRSDVVEELRLFVDDEEAEYLFKS